MGGENESALQTALNGRPGARKLEVQWKVGWGESERGWFRGTPFRSPLQGGLKGLGARGGGGTKV